MVSKAEKLRRAELKNKENEVKERLIQEVFIEEAIWDKRLRCHRERNVVDACWDRVAVAMSIDKAECKRLWKVLADHFRSLFNEFVHGGRSGDGINDVALAEAGIKWIFFKQLLFLKDVVTNRKGKSNLKDTEMSETQETEDRDTPDSDLVAHVNARDQLEFFEGNYYEDEDNNLLGLGEDDPGTTEETSDEISDENVTRHVSPSHPAGSSTTPVRASNNSNTVPTSQRSDDSSRPSQLKRSTTPKQKKKTAVPLDEVDKQLLESLSAASRELANNKPDSASSFGAYIADLVRDVPPRKRRKCEMKMIEVATSFMNDSDSDSN